MSRRVLVLVMLLTGATLLLHAEPQFVRTPRDTGLPPQAYSQDMELGSKYALLTRTETLELHYRDDRSVLAIVDLRNGYIWKTGLDIAFSRDLDDLVDEGADPLALPPVEERLNTTYTGIANSIIFIEYFDGANNIKRVGSAAREDVVSRLDVQSSDPFRSRLTVEFQDIDLTVRVEMSVDDDTLVFRIPDSDLTGPGLKRLGSIGIAPFLGASGGRQLWWDREEEDWEISRPRELIPGYVVVPDGSGALVRFAHNTSDLSEYVGDIYGEDLSQSGLFRSFDDFSVPPKDAHLPLFGVVHGRDQNAFAGFATRGAEYMEVVAFPEENTTYYTWAYPRFIYNRLYYQVYNKKGDGYYRLLEERNHFTAELRYRFLASQPDTEAGYPADYTGIALAYRDHLKDDGVLPERVPRSQRDIPLRLDILMADVRDSIIGTTHEVTTTITQVDQIVSDLEAAGITELSVGLMGYARGGTVLSKPGTVRLLPGVGRAREFRDVIGGLTSRGIDVSMGRDYALIGQGQILPWGNAIRGASGWYNELITYQANAPVNTFYLARPVRIVEWLRREAAEMRELGVTSITVDGIGPMLSSDYSEQPALSVTDVSERYRSALARERRNLQINVVRPNQYLWSMTDRFLQAPLFSTQYLLETDTVPLLQLVLHGSMEVFGPYSNFSFYSDADVLRMIDYNVYPSFLVTAESAHLLLMTNSAEYYSTQYTIYRDLIVSVYARVNAVLREVLGASWTGRAVVSPGVIVNSYDNGVKIVINYTESPFTYRGETVPALEARVYRVGTGAAP
jgi:hypothetical protein